MVPGGAGDTRLNHLFDVVKALYKQDDQPYDDKMDQLKLRQIMNLKAKGFYLDNSDEISKMQRKQ
jgi:hypothetical protein